MLLLYLPYAPLRFTFIASLSLSLSLSPTRDPQFTNSPEYSRFNETRTLPSASSVLYPTILMYPPTSHPVGSDERRRPGGATNHDDCHDHFRALVCWMIARGYATSNGLEPALGAAT